MGGWSRLSTRGRLVAAGIEVASLVPGSFVLLIVLVQASLEHDWSARSSDAWVGIAVLAGAAVWLSGAIGGAHAGLWWAPAAAFWGGVLMIWIVLGVITSTLPPNTEPPGFG